MSADSQRLIDYIYHLAGASPSTPSDGELLRRYLVTHEEAAFTALVRRHGPMVFAVCQSVLRQREDAEDAFQAAFLILARKGDSIHRQEGLSGWLQRVAYRVALRARAGKARRQEREAKTARSDVAEPAGDELSWGEMRSILHAELAALPERFRAPLVLCYLEGLTQEEAARRLGWTATTVKGRLQRGRDKLRRRLERRGVALTAALGAALTGQALAETAVKTIPPFTAATATSTAAALAHTILQPLVSLKMMVLSAVVLTAGLSAGGLAVLSSKPKETAPPAALGEKPPDQRPTPPPAVDAHGDPLPDGAVARLGTIRFNHGDGLHSLFFSSDGKTIISEGKGSIRFWDARNGKEQDRIDTGKSRTYAFQTTILADGKTLISLSEGIDNRDVAIFWDLAEKKRLRTKELPVRRSVLFTKIRDSLSPDGKLCVMHVYKPPYVQVSDVKTGKILYKLARGTKTLLAVAFADNDHLVSADEKNRLEVWEARTGKFIRQLPHDAPIRYLVASPDGRWLAGLEQPPQPEGRIVRQEMVYLWEMKTGLAKQMFRAKSKHWFTNVCFSPDSKTLLTSSRNESEPDEVLLWDCAKGRRLLTFDSASGINADIAAFSPEGSRLAAGNSAGKFELWDIKNGHRLSSEDSRQLRGGSIAVLTPSGERATIMSDKHISSWNATNGKRLHASERRPPGDFCDIFQQNLSPDGRYAMTCRIEGKEFHILIWDIAAEKCLHTLRFTDGYQEILRGYQQIPTAFAPDSSLLATRHSGKQTLLQFWDLRTGKLVRSFEDKKSEWPGKMAFTADGTTLFVAGSHIVGFDVSSGKEKFSWHMKTIPHPSGVSIGSSNIAWRGMAVSPDGTRIAVTFNNGFGRDPMRGRIALFDAHTGKLLRRWNDSGRAPILFDHLCFSRDGQLLASSDGQAIHLWEAATTKEIRTFRGHRGEILCLSFSRDGRRLASSSWDSTILIWDVTGSPGLLSTNAALEESWKTLAGDDAGRSLQAVWAMARTADKAIPFLKERLKAVKPISREKLDRLVADLDANEFDVRQNASAELEKLGEVAEPALRRALANKPTLEQRRRIEPILAKLETAIPSGEALRSLRAVRVLEHAGTPEAQRLLRELANGAEGAALTRAAQAARKRLARQAPKTK